MPRVFRKTHTHLGVTLDKTFPTAKLANEWKAEMVKQSLRAKAGLPSLSNETPFDLAAAKWTLLRKASMDYWKTDEAKMRRAFVPFFGKKSIRAIRKSDCEMALHTARTEMRLSNATFNRYRACLRSFFEYAIDEGYCEINPVARIESLAETKRGAHIPDELVEAYVKRAGEEKARWFLPFIVLAMNAGPRQGELLGFFWSDYHPELGRMMITRRFQVMLNRLKEGTKGGGGRAIPLNTFAIDVLENFRKATPHNKPEDLIFHKENGERISASTLSQTHRRVARAVGISDKVRLYDITRHKFASKITAALGLRAAQSLLGHASSLTTERYAHDEPDHLIGKAVGVSVGDGKPLH